MRLRLLVLSVGLLGCSTPFAMKEPSAQVTPARLVAIPAQVDSFEVDSDNKISRLPDQQAKARESIGASLNYAVSTRGGRFFDDKTVAGLPDAYPFLKWSERSMLEIGHEIEAAAAGRSTRPGVSAWEYDDDLDAWREALKADYVLVSMFLDGENSGGRAALNVLASGFGGTSVSGRNEGMACIVDLASGRMVWCARVFPAVSVRSRPGAQKAVDDLLKGLFSPNGAAAHP